MEEGRGKGGGGRAEDSKRSSISLPPHSAVESLFRGGQLEASPGPMSLVSSFFAEDPDAECRSFSQLLAGAMASPPAAAAAFLGKFPAEDEGTTTSIRSSEEAAANGRGGRGSLNLGHSRPTNLLMAQLPFFTVPPGFSPGGLLESPAMFSSNLGNFAFLHQAQSAQATHSHVQMNNQEEKASSLSLASMVHTSGAMIKKPLRIQSLNQVTNGHASNSFVASDIRSQLASITIDKPADDGYNWRKYGQKQVKGSEFPRSYYKCTHPNCLVKKKVERSLDGQVTEIIYKGQHNHLKPQSNKRAKEGNMSSGSPESNGNANFSMNSETHMLGDPSNDNTSVRRRDRECKDGASEQLSGSSDDENGRLDEAEGCGEPDQKKRNLETRVIESASHRTVTEPRIIVQTTSEVDLLDDGYKWRKYGQKVVKGNPHPRSYYKCTSAGCNVRKHVERASSDPRAVVTTYEGKHNHNVPVARNSSHNTTTVAAANSRPQNSISTDQNIQRSSVQRPVPILQLKEENQIA